MKKLLLLALFAVLFASSAFSQQPDPTPTGKPIKIVSERSLSDLTAADTYTSPDGKFSISLPKEPDRAQEITSAMMGDPGSGNAAGWLMKEGLLTITYFDYSDPSQIPKTDAHLAQFFDGFKSGVLKSIDGKFLSERMFKIGDKSAYEFKFETADGSHGIARSFYVGQRTYALIAAPKPGVANAEALIAKALDSFASKTK